MFDHAVFLLSFLCIQGLFCCLVHSFSSLVPTATALHQLFHNLYLIFFQEALTFRCRVTNELNIILPACALEIFIVFAALALLLLDSDIRSCILIRCRHSILARSIRILCLRTFIFFFDSTCGCTFCVTPRLL